MPTGDPTNYFTAPNTSARYIDSKDYIYEFIVPVKENSFVQTNQSPIQQVEEAWVRQLRLEGFKQEARIKRLLHEDEHLTECPTCSYPYLDSELIALATKHRESIPSSTIYMAYSNMYCCIACNARWIPTTTIEQMFNDTASKIQFDIQPFIFENPSLNAPQPVYRPGDPNGYQYFYYPITDAPPLTHGGTTTDSPPNNTPIPVTPVVSPAHYDGWWETSRVVTPADAQHMFNGNWTDSDSNQRPTHIEGITGTTEAPWEYDDPEVTREVEERRRRNNRNVRPVLIYNNPPLRHLNINLTIPVEPGSLNEQTENQDSSRENNASNPEG